MKRKWRLAIIAPVVAGLAAAGVYATSLSLSANRGTQQQAGAQPDIAVRAKCQNSPLAISTDYSAPLSPTNGFEATLNGYAISGISPDCAGKDLSLAVKLDSRGSPQCAAAPALVNGDFDRAFNSVPWDETYFAYGYKLINTVNNPQIGWRNTAEDVIELMLSGANGQYAVSGDQYAELNATQAGTLYQDLATTPGQTMTWSFWHRARNGDGPPWAQTGTNTMRFLIGPPSGSLVAQGPDKTSPGDQWVQYSGQYTVPAGQTTTRFAFQSVAGLSPAVGNLLDSVSFTVTACESPKFQKADATINLDGSSTVFVASDGAVALTPDSIKRYSVRIR